VIILTSNNGRSIGEYQRVDFIIVRIRVCREQKRGLSTIGSGTTFCSVRTQRRRNTDIDTRVDCSTLPAGIRNEASIR